MTFFNTIEQLKKFRTWRMLAIFLPFLIILFWLDILTWQIPLALFLSFVAYMVLQDRLWELLILAAPAIALGSVVNLQITPSLVYEMTLTEVILGLVLVVFLLKLVFSLSLGKIRFDWFLLIMLAYTAWAISTYDRSVNFHLYIYQVKLLLFSLIGYFLAINLLDEMYKLKAFFLSLAITAMLLSAELFWKFVAMGFSFKFFTDRSSIILPVGALALAASLLAMLLPLLLALGLAEKSKVRKFIFLLAVIVGLVAVFMTMGKAAIGSLALALLVLFVKFRSKRLAMLLALNLFLVTVFVFLTPYLSGFMTRLATISTDNNISFRLDEYTFASKILHDNWLTGVRLGQETVAFARFYPFEYHELVNNYWLEILLDLGIIGLGFAVLAFGYLIQQLRKLLAASRNLREFETWIAYGLLGSAIVVFMNGLAEVTIFALNYALILWLLIGAGISFVRLRSSVQII
jgi:O-antigen ligase